MFFRIIASGVTAMFTAPTALRHQKEDAAGELMSGMTCLPHRCSSPASGSTRTPTSGPPSGGIGHRQLVADRNRLADHREPARRAHADQARLPVSAGAGYESGPRRAEPGGPGRAGGRDLHQAADAAGTLPTLWQDDERYVSSYLSAYEGYYLTGDGGLKDEDGYLFVMGRTDDVINVAGHRLSTGSIEAALAGHPAVAECAVIGVADDFKGQVPRGLVVLKGGIDADAEGDQIVKELVQRVRGEVGAVAALKQVDIVAALPKTRSGKILRKTMREIADGKTPTVPGTIEDASVLDQLAETLKNTVR